jgi:hypothetical protein
MAMDTQVDLYRSVKPSELLTKFKFNSSAHAVTFEQLFLNAPPKLLGSFKLGKGRKEVDLISSGAVLESIPGSFRPEICSVRRLNDGGISCFNEQAQLSDLVELPPVGDIPLDSHQWYFLEAAAIDSNETLRVYLNQEPDNRNFEYNEQRASVFLCFQLVAGTRLPAGFEDHFDNDPPGHWTIRRGDDNQFDAHFCQIGGGFNYAMIPELVNMGWIFLGLKLRAGAEPTDFNASFDKDTWTLAIIIYEYFSCLSTEELVNDANTVLSDLSAGRYVRETCGPITTKMLLRVLDDLVMYSNEQELNTVSRFRLGLNEA